MLPSEHAYLLGVSSNIQTQLNGKLASVPDTYLLKTTADDSYETKGSTAASAAAASLSAAAAALSVTAAATNATAAADSATTVAQLQPQVRLPLG